MSKETIRVLAFDPGIVKMGWALLEYNCSTGAITALKHGTLNGLTLVRRLKDLLQIFNKSFTTLKAYEAVIRDMIAELKPDEVVSEDAFYHKFPQSFASLLLVIHTIRNTVFECLGKNIHIVAPMETKKVITGKGNNVQKEQMREGVLEGTHVTILETKQFPLASADEHAIDAIGHGTTFIVKQLNAMLADAACQELEKKKAA